MSNFKIENSSHLDTNSSTVIFIVIQIFSEFVHLVSLARVLRKNVQETE